MREHGRLCVATFVDPNFGENSYLLWTTEGPDAWIIDPGFSPATESLVTAARERRLTPRAILLTHCHFDHIAGVAAAHDAFPEARILAPDGETDMLPDPTANLSLLIGMPVTAPPADRTIQPGDVLTLGTLEFRALDVRGHSPGGRAYSCPEAGVVFCGDALFAGGIGRTDFPGSSEETLLANIHRHLLTLPDETVVYSGHGPATTIGDERETNPCL